MTCTFLYYSLWLLIMGPKKWIFFFVRGGVWSFFCIGRFVNHMFYLKVYSMKAKHFIGALFIAIAGGLIAVFAYTRFSPAPVRLLPANTTSLSYTSSSYADSASLASGMMLPDFTRAAEKSIHSVVNVRTVSMETSPQSLWEYLYGYQPQRRIIEGIGSGVIISADGYIVTNNHVVEGSNQIKVTLNDKREFDARLVGADPNTDMAVLKIEAKELPFLIFGNSEALRVGEWVLAIGNPFNLTSTVTAGIVSAKARQIGIIGDRNERQQQISPQELFGRSPFRGRQGQGQGPNAQGTESLTLESLIQTDAAVNNGNSGGALVNIRGELVGINTAIASRTGEYSGTSFAVPSSIARKVVADFIEFGSVQRALLGVHIDEVNSVAAKEAGVKRTDGVYVGSLDAKSGAEKAGVKAGDVILSVNGVKVNSVPALQEQVGRYRPNDQVDLVLVRAGKEMTLKVTLLGVDGSAEIVRLEDSEKELGSKFAVVTANDKQKLRVQNGVKVAELRPGKLSNAGVRLGFVITRINDVPVNGISDISAVLAKVADNGRVVVDGVYPDGQVAYYVFAR